MKIKIEEETFTYETSELTGKYFLYSNCNILEILGTLKPTKRNFETFRKVSGTSVSKEVGTPIYLAKNIFIITDSVFRDDNMKTDSIEIPNYDYEVMYHLIVSPISKKLLKNITVEKVLQIQKAHIEEVECKLVKLTRHVNENLLTIKEVML